jgi:uncharacterized protein YprB with RNaseH-like and TPR domain
VRLNRDVRKAEQILRELTEMLGTGVAPRLILNDHCQVCEFRQRCHQQAVQEDNLSLLRGLSEKQVKGFARKGILTLSQFAATFRPRRRSKRQRDKPPRRYHALQALAIRDRKVYVLGTPELPDSPVRIYLDIESDPEEGYVYLIGMLVVQGASAKSCSFWADSKDQEAAIFEQFLAEVCRHDNCVVLSYGSYERTFLQRMRHRASSAAQVDRALAALVNVLGQVYGHVYFPCCSNGLKDVAGCLGCRWSEPEASGLQSIVWRKSWQASRAEQGKQKLVIYNQEDCAALKKVADFLYALKDVAKEAAVPSSEGDKTLPVKRAEDLEAHPTRRSWCKATFFLPQFAEINECAYFDYQRDRVFIRTNPTLARGARRKKKKKPARRLPINKRVDLTVQECPHCHSSEIIPSDGRARRKVIYDLKFSSRGITRVVTECVARPAHCARCSAVLPADHIDRLARYQHSLRSWVVFEHVVHRVGSNKLGAVLEQYFGIRACRVHLLKLKDLMARYYQPTSQVLLKRLVAGNLIHADETTIEVKGGEGYVWVFTNLEEVVYLYKPTREGTFLHDLLRGFSGVLVSDFFSGYDSLPCAQQKCLIHLMRDLNHDLFHAPLDCELKAVASRFGHLLRSIVSTVDRRGLRSKHLSRHKSAVDRFFATLAEESYTSEVAQGYQARFLKNRDRLFTFLDHDGVPWNNNNAEHAIKQFAYYRRICASHISLAGLEEYLVLLSIAQTCKYKGVSFFQFLLSRELDIDQFVDGAGKRPSSQAPDYYPKGFSIRRFGERKLPCD